MNTKTNLTVEGITCGGCANSIKSALGRLEGVSNVQVDVDTKTVTVEHDEQRATRHAVVEALDKAGFPAR
jgi:copper chaperone